MPVSKSKTHVFSCFTSPNVNTPSSGYTPVKVNPPVNIAAAVMFLSRSQNGGVKVVFQSCVPLVSGSRLIPIIQPCTIPRLSFRPAVPTIMYSSWRIARIEPVSLRRALGGLIMLGIEKFCE